MTTWRKHPIEYIDEANDTIYLSIVFTWHLRAARARAVWRQKQGYHVRAGGPAVQAMPHMLQAMPHMLQAMPHMLQDVADLSPLGPNPRLDPLSYHNPDATFTTRGCPNSCPFCTVPRIEGKLQQLVYWRPAPIVCDNNLLASSREHFDTVIDRLRPFRGRVDFVQGLDTRLLTPYHAARIAELQPVKLRLAWDTSSDEPHARRAYQLIRDAGIPARRMFFYVLIGFDDTPAEAEYRLQSIANLPAQPYPMRYQPLDALEKNSHVAPDWTEAELRRFTQYWTRYYHYRKTPFSEFRIQRAKPMTRPNDLVRFHTILGHATSPPLRSTRQAAA